jgi:hypothetical protein
MLVDESDAMVVFKVKGSGAVCSNLEVCCIVIDRAPDPSLAQGQRRMPRLLCTPTESC